MSDSLDTLLDLTSVKEFAKQFKALQAHYPEPRAFLADLAGDLAPRLYERYYGDSFPHSLLALAAAQEASTLLPREEQWKPVAQHTWFAARERKRNPLELGAIAPESSGSLEERMGAFERALEERSFPRAMALLKGCLAESESREALRRRSLACAMEDGAYLGHKFVYLARLWKLAEWLDWQHAEELLAAGLHLLVLGEREGRTWGSIEEFLSRHSWNLGQGELSPEAVHQVESALLFSSDPGEVFTVLAREGEGSSACSLLGALLVTAAQGVVNSAPGQWLAPVRAFHFAASLFHSGPSQPDRQVRALLAAAAHIHRASARSRDVARNRRLDEVIRQLCPWPPFEVLPSVISHSDPHASATAVLAILGMGEARRPDLIHALLAQALKNDGEAAQGHDLLYVCEVARCCSELSPEQQERLLVSAGYLLGRVHKSYEFFGAYGF